jgi:hypothetical protein
MGYNQIFVDRVGDENGRADDNIPTWAAMWRNILPS